jgi:hypothetical protein
MNQRDKNLLLNLHHPCKEQERRNKLEDGRYELCDWQGDWNGPFYVSFKLIASSVH